MGIISVEQVKPGMVLAEKVMTPKRMMLLPEGVTLTEAHLVTFATWGISEVNIEGEGGGEGGGELSPEEREALESKLKVIFKHNDLSKPIAKKLFQIVCEHSGSNS